MNIVKLKETDTDKIRLVKTSLIGLRDYYPEFSNWFDSKILPNINKSRNIFLAYNSNGFGGTLITKNDKEKKICTLFVREENRYNRLGSDFLRIASEELETYKLPITVSKDVINVFTNANGFNFFTERIENNLYKKDVDEYIGYILFHNPDLELKRLTK